MTKGSLTQLEARRASPLLTPARLDVLVDNGCRGSTGHGSLQTLRMTFVFSSQFSFQWQHHRSSAIGFACTTTFLILTSSFGLFFLSTATSSNLSNVSQPSNTLPNTVFLPSRCGALSNVTKNWLPFVAGPLFAMLRIPRALCRKDDLISSSNVSPYTDGESFVEPVKGDPP